MNLAPAEQGITSEGLQRHAIMLRAGAAQAVKAVEWLLAEGFEPIKVSVDAERRCPVIDIRTIGKCGWLKANFAAAPYTIQPGWYGTRSTTYRVSILGCKVQWTEGGH